MRTLEITRFREAAEETLHSSIHDHAAAFYNSSSIENDTHKKLSYFNIVGQTPLLGFTTGDMINQSAEKYGDKDALVVPFQNIRLTFNQLKDEVDRFAGGLLSLGLKSGDRLGIWSPNTYECYIAQLAGWKAGLVVVCINAALQKRELLYSLNKVGVRCLIISKPFRNQNFYEILTGSVPEIKTSEPGSLKSPEAPELEFVISVDSNLPGTLSFSYVQQIGENNIIASLLDSVDVQFDDVSTLFFTSGTTGCPKAVMISHHSWINNANSVGRRIQLNENDRICLPVPIFHLYGCQIGIFAALQYGATVVMPSFGYDAKAILEVSSDERCTVIAGTPTMFADLLKGVSDIGARLDLSSLKTAVTAGALCSEQLLKDIRTKLHFKNVFNNYGMTELGCAYLSLPTDTDITTSTTVGYPCENLEVKLVDRYGRMVPLGDEGELCVRGYNVTHGYWGEPEKTSEVLETSRWLHTGDILVMMESGHAKVVGRLKEMVNRGGENVYPREVEDFLKTHPKIEDAQLFGVPDSRMGEEPAVWIQLKEGEVMTPNDLKAFCKGQIAHFKIPKYILFRDDFPRTPLGKVQKFRMREETIQVLKL